MVSDWKYVSDRVMGGVSEGNVYLEKDGDTSFARLIGDVSTRNNGGFIQLRSAVSLFKKPKMFQLIHDANKEGQGASRSSIKRSRQWRDLPRYDPHLFHLEAK